MMVAGLIVALAAACPDDARVADGLALAAPRELREKYKWSVTVSGDSMRVALLDSSGAVVRERVVPAPAKCAERETVAVAVLGAWIVSAPVPVEPVVEAPVEKKKPGHEVRAPPARPEPPATLDDPLTPSLSPTRGEGAPDLPPSPPSPPEPPAEEAPPVSAPVVEAPPPPAPAASSPSSLRFELAFDARGQYASGLAPGLGLTASLGGKLAGFFEVSTALARSLQLPPGQVRWFRIAFGLGARYRFELPWLYVEPMLSAEAALLRLEGQGFVQNAVVYAPDLSVCAQLRAGHAFNDALAVFIGARACAWPMQGRAQVISVSETAPLPTFEVAALVGISGGYSFVKGPAATRPSEK